MRIPGVRSGLIALVGLCFSVLEGCTTVCVVSPTATETPYWQTQRISYADLRERAAGDEVSITIEGDRVRTGRLEASSPDSIVWEDLHSHERVAVATSTVRGLTFSHHFAVEGAVGGFVLGVVPLLASGSWAVTYDGNEHTPQYTGRQIAAYVGAIGAITGLFAGACIAHTYECTFEENPPSQSVSQPPPH